MSRSIDLAVRARMRADRFAALVGVRLAEVRPGYARATLRLGPHHQNGVGVVQGGAVFTLADLAFAAASNSHGTIAVALDVSITFARAARAGALTAVAREVSLGRRISVCEVQVTDGAGEIVALFHGTAYRLGDGAPAGTGGRAAAGRPPPRRSAAELPEAPPRPGRRPAKGAPLGATPPRSPGRSRRAPQRKRRGAAADDRASLRRALHGSPRPLSSPAGIPRATSSWMMAGQAKRRGG